MVAKLKSLRTAFRLWRFRRTMRKIGINPALVSETRQQRRRRYQLIARRLTPNS